MARTRLIVKSGIKAMSPGLLTRVRSMNLLESLIGIKRDYKVSKLLRPDGQVIRRKTIKILGNNLRIEYPGEKGKTLWIYSRGPWYTNANL